MEARPPLGLEVVPRDEDYSTDGIRHHRSERALRIFIIPSWFPSQTSPFAGIFIEDQVRALARRRPGWQVAVSTWGQDETVVELRRPVASLARVLDRRRHRPSVDRLETAIVYSTPVVHSTPRLLGGRLDAIVEANRANADRARSELGDLDLIHAHAAFPAGLIALQLSRELRIPYVVTEHSGRALQARVERTELGRKAFTEGLSQAAATIAVSRALGRRLTESGTPVTDVIPNVVDEDFFTPAQAPPPPIARPRVFTLGRLVEGKGIVELLEATARLRTGGQPVELRIGGDGPRRREWQRHADSLGLAHDVRFLGTLTREAVREELRKCSCFALASESETFGVVCIEALASGRPLVATSSGGPEDIVTDENGVLVPVGDVEGLAAGVRAVLSRNYDAEAIRSDAIRRFGSEAVVSALEGVYSRVTGDEAG
jgi:glycosyltransferase involved in cell wall biosynthesis